MNTFFSILLTLFLIPCLLPAQEDPNLKIMMTVVPIESIESIDLMISVPDEYSGNSIQFSPNTENSGLLMISGRPYDVFQIQIPAETSIVNQYGDEALLIDHQLLSGYERDVESMQVIPSAECSELSIPESGQVYLRIGGKAVAEKTLRGYYRGTLSLDCEID